MTESVFFSELSEAFSYIKSVYLASNDFAFKELYILRAEISSLTLSL